VQIDNAVDALVVILKGHVVLDGAQIVAQVLTSGRTCTREDPTFLRHESSLNDVVDEPNDFARLCMTLGRELGVDQPTVHADLEATAVGRNQGDAFHQVLKVLEELACQANGPVCVVSDGTVNDFDLKHPASSISIGPGRLAIHRPGRCTGTLELRPQPPELLENYNMHVMGLCIPGPQRYNPIR
jgi:hypothetical protein